LVKECQEERPELSLVQGALAFEEVLTSFPEAREVWIATFNFETDHTSRLVKDIVAIGSTVPVTIVTNIPGRFRRYANAHYRASAQKRIAQYLSALKPARLGNKVGVYFNFSNHAKIIATDRVAYVGSANYSGASLGNYEAGVLLRAGDDIRFVREALDSLVRGSLPYVDVESSPCVQSLISLRSALDGLAETIDESCFAYEYYGAVGEELRLFGQEAAGIDESTAAETGEVLQSIVDLHSDSTLPGGLVELIRRSLPLDRAEAVMPILEEGSAVRRFSERGAMVQEFVEEHAYEAYDEKVDEYCMKASEHVDGVLDDMRDEASGQADQLISTLTYYSRNMTGLLEWLCRDDPVDNTGRATA